MFYSKELIFGIKWNVIWWFWFLLQPGPDPARGAEGEPSSRSPRRSKDSHLSSPQLAGAPVIGNKVSPWPLEQQTCDEETSLIDDNR